MICLFAPPLFPGHPRGSSPPAAARHPTTRIAQEKREEEEEISQEFLAKSRDTPRARTCIESSVAPERSYAHSHAFVGGAQRDGGVRREGGHACRSDQPACASVILTSVLSAKHSGVSAPHSHDGSGKIVRGRPTGVRGMQPILGQEGTRIKVASEPTGEHVITRLIPERGVVGNPTGAPRQRVCSAFLESPRGAGGLRVHQSFWQEGTHDDNKHFPAG